MLGLNELKQTKVYQEAKQEGLEEGELKAKLEAIPRMLEFGLSLEQIAELQDLPLAAVQQAARSFHEQQIAAFIELLERQRSLFSPQDLADLAELIEPLPDRTEDLSNAIVQWCKQEGHSAQLEAWRQVLSGLLSARVEKLLGTHPDTLPTPSSAIDKATLQKAIENDVPLKRNQ
jgi:DNA-binding transcriptional MerR regulator